MDGTATVRRPRGPNSPRQRVEKTPKAPRKGKGKAKEEDTGEKKVKLELERDIGGREDTVESERPVGERRVEKRFKREPGLALGVASTSQSESHPTPRTMPSTPTEYTRVASGSPSPDPSEMFEEGGGYEMDEMGFSFGARGNEGLPGMYDGLPMMNQGTGAGFGGGIGSGYGMGIQMGMGDPYEGLWHGHGHANAGHGGQRSGMLGGEGGVQVKTEPRWEEAYRHA